MRKLRGFYRHNSDHFLQVFLQICTDKLDAILKKIPQNIKKSLLHVKIASEERGKNCPISQQDKTMALIISFRNKNPIS
jgi:hypothetical protein